MEQSVASRRRRFSAEERARCLELYGQSGLSPRACAQEQGIHLSTLHRWLRQSKKSAKARGPAFKEFPLPAPASVWSVEIAVGPELTVRLASAASADFIVQLASRLRRSC